MPIIIEAVGDRIVALKMKIADQQLHDKLKQIVGEKTAALLAAIIAAEPVRTGRLRSRTRAIYRDTATTISGTIRAGARGPDLAKAGALEFGAHRAIAVKAYEREGEAVSAYHRNVNIAARRFLRDPFEAMKPEIETAIEKAVADVTKEADS